MLATREAADCWAISNSISDDVLTAHTGLRHRAVALIAMTVGWLAPDQAQSYVLAF
jgi:hypothetical protein